MPASLTTANERPVAPTKVATVKVASMKTSWNVVGRFESLPLIFSQFDGNGLQVGQFLTDGLQFDANLVDRRFQPGAEPARSHHRVADGGAARPTTTLRACPSGDPHGAA